MKTVHQLMQEHRECIDEIRSPIFRFKIGDVLKQSPKKAYLGFTTKGGTVVGINESIITIEFKPGSYDTESIHEVLLMPAEE